jgi:hypothetical protein
MMMVSKSAMVFSVFGREPVAQPLPHPEDISANVKG